MRKFYLAGISAVIGGVLVASGAKAYSYIDITSTSSTALASTTAYIANLFSDVAPFIWLAIGLPLGFWVITKTIGLIRGRAR